MLSLTRKTEYALRVLADLAGNSSGRCSARLLAERHKVPARVLTNILNQLSRHGVVVSVRGANGGYRLSRSAKRISLMAILEAIEGPFQLTRCCPTNFDIEDQDCEARPDCRIKECIHTLHSYIRQLLERVTLDEVACNSLALGIDAVVDGGPSEAARGSG